jgi:hypothetical protein
LLNKNTRTIERHLKALREQGRIQRVGSDKTGAIGKSSKDRRERGQAHAQSPFNLDPAVILSS